MKNLIIIFLSLVTILQAQTKKDTIYVSTNFTTTLVFDETISFHDIGNYDFGLQTEGNSVFIKAAKSNGQTTTLLIKHGNSFYNALLVYKAEPKVTFYDYRKGFSPTSSTTGLVNESTSIEMESNYQVDLEKLEKFLVVEPEYKSLGKVQNKMLISLQNMEATGKEMKVKILIKNMSQFDYEIDFTKFEFVENKGGLTGKNRREKRTPLEPLWFSDTNIIEQNDEEELYFILPKYSTNFIGKFVISIWEKNGGRTIEIKVPSKYIL